MNKNAIVPPRLEQQLELRPRTTDINGKKTVRAIEAAVRANSLSGAEDIRASSQLESHPRRFGNPLPVRSRI
jgi:hypothetical protein